MTAVLLNHGLSACGEPGPQWSTGEPFWAEVPGGRAELLVIRDRARVRALARDDSLRNLALTAPWHAVGGVSLQHRHGMLRLAGTDARQVRRLTEPAFAPKVAGQYERWLYSIAEACAKRVRPGDDLIKTFCIPYVMDAIRLLAGVDPERLRELSDRTTGTLICQVADHAPVSESWDELYEFTEPAVYQARYDWGESMMPRAIQAMDAELPHGMTWRAATTIYNGFPTVLSAVIRLMEYLLTHDLMLDACRDHPGLIPGTVQSALLWAVHFTFGLPGVCTRTATLDGYTITEGTTVLPVFHGARSAMARGQAGLIAWGAPGLHACLGMHIARLILEAAAWAASTVTPRPRLAVPRSGLAHVEGTMPLAAELPVT
jgi:cytochrome P450